MTKSTCDVCGKSDRPTTVACSGLGAFSLAYCDVCRAIYAEPNFAVETVGEEVCDICTVYDHERDCYLVPATNEPCPIELKDGTKFDTRSEFVAYLDEKKPRD